MKFSVGSGNTESKTPTKDILKLKDGDQVEGVFRGDPVEYRQHWPQGGRPIICPDDGTCPACAANDKPSFRFRINFVVKDKNNWVPMVWEQGWTVYNQLKSMHENDYPLNTTIVKIRRTGEGMNDTSYTILPSPQGVVSKELNDQLNKLQLHDLTVKAADKKAS
jgi:hypothetical protein